MANLGSFSNKNGKDLTLIKEEMWRNFESARKDSELKYRSIETALQSMKEV